MKRIWCFLCLKHLDTWFASSIQIIMSWFYSIFVYKVQNKFKIEQRFDEIWPTWQMDKQLKETTTRKKNLLCWFDKNLQNGQNDDGKKTFFKSNHSMLVEAWKKLFAINDWWSLLADLISPIIHQASATFHNCIHVQFIGQSHDNMSTRRKFFIKRGVVDLKFWIHSWDRKCKPKWQKPFVSCL